MTVIGVGAASHRMVLWTGRDFRWVFDNLDATDAALDYPPGSLYFELGTTPATTWVFVIDGAVATLKVEHTDADQIPARTPWQLVWLPDGEAAGGDPIARGVVERVN